MADTPAQRITLDIQPSDWATWWQSAKALGEAGEALRRELANFTSDPTVQQLERAAKAARYAESVTTGDEQLLANVLAAGFEEIAAAAAARAR